MWLMPWHTLLSTSIALVVNNRVSASPPPMGDVTTSTNITAAEAPLWNTAAHHGPAVSVVSWFCIVAVVLAIAGRIVTRYATIRTLRRDDLVILGATVGPSPSMCERILTDVDHRWWPLGNPSQCPWHRPMAWVLMQIPSTRIRLKAFTKYVATSLGHLVSSFDTDVIRSSRSCMPVNSSMSSLSALWKYPSAFTCTTSPPFDPAILPAPSCQVSSLHGQWHRCSWLRSSASSRSRGLFLRVSADASICWLSGHTLVPSMFLQTWPWSSWCYRYSSSCRCLQVEKPSLSAVTRQGSCKYLDVHPPVMPRLFPSYSFKRHS